MAQGCGSERIRLGEEHGDGGESEDLPRERLEVSELPDVDISQVRASGLTLIRDPGPRQSAYTQPKIVRVSDHELALLRAGHRDGGIWISLEVLSEDGETHAATEYQLDGYSDLQRGPVIRAGYDGQSLWVGVARIFTPDFRRFDADLTLTQGPETQTVAVSALRQATAESHIYTVAVDQYGAVSGFPADSACRVIGVGEGWLGVKPTIHGAVAVDATVWMHGCSSPPRDLPNAHAKPALYACSQDGILQRQIELDLLSSSNGCLGRIAFRGTEIVSLIRRPGLAVALDLAGGRFAARRFTSTDPSANEAHRDQGDGSGRLRQADVLNVAVGPAGEVVVALGDPEDVGSPSLLCFFASGLASEPLCTRATTSVFDTTTLVMPSRHVFYLTPDGALMRWSPSDEEGL